MSQQQVRVVIDGDVRRQHEIAHVNAFANLKRADVGLDRLRNGAGLALDPQRVHQVLEDSAGRQARRRCP